MKYLCFLLLTFFTSHSALAVSQGGYFKVTRLYVWTSGDIHLWVDKAGSHTCSEQRWPNRYLLYRDAAGFDAKYSLLLSARIAEGKVNMEYTCKNGHPYIQAIRF